MASDRRRRPATRPADADPLRQCSAAVAELAAAWDSARDVKSDPWDFAVAIGDLLALGIGKSALRWLVKRSYAAHAREVTRPADAARRFQPELSLAFMRRTCFILTGAGRSALAAAWPVPALLRLHRGSTATPAVAAAMPHWDQWTRTLYLGDQIVKQFRVPAGNQEAVLSAFEEEGWMQIIDDPLPPVEEVCCGMRLRDTLRRLNARQTSHLLHFYGDGTGRHVLWKRVSEVTLPLEVARQDGRRAA